MKKIGALLIAVAIIAGSTGCSKQENSGGNNNAAIMFVNACTAGAIDLKLDGKVNSAAVSGATQLKFLAHSGYGSVPAGSAKVAFYIPGSSEFVSGDRSLTATSHYTAFASGSLQRPRFAFAEDNLVKPSSGKAKVRFANLAGDSLTVSCYFNGTKLVPNLRTDEISPFFEITAATGKLFVQDTLDNGNYADLSSQAFAADKIYTVMFTGTTVGTGTSALTLTIINNQ